MSELIQWTARRYAARRVLLEAICAGRVEKLVPGRQYPCDHCGEAATRVSHYQASSVDPLDVVVVCFECFVKMESARGGEMP